MAEGNVTEAVVEAAARAVSSPRVKQVQTLLFISGFSALVLEVVYVKLLRYWAGNTAYAVAAVLCAYMAGLAAGSFAAGKWLLSRRRLLAVYGSLELLIGLYSLGLPRIERSLEPLYLSLTARLGPDSLFSLGGHFLAAVTLLLFPTLLMGATYPVAVRAASQALTDTVDAAEKIYYANLAGAAVGTLVSDFLLIRFWGLGNSLKLVASLNACLALAAWLLQAKEQPTLDRVAPPQRADATRPAGQAWVWCVAFTGGFLVLIQELVWTNMVGRFLDNTVYGFAVTLFAVIAGLGAGAALVTRWFASRGGGTLVGWPCLAAGALSLAVLPFWNASRALAVNHPWICVAMAALLLAGVVAAVQPRAKAVLAFLALEGGLVAAVLVRQHLDPDGAEFWVRHGVDFSVSAIFLVIPAVLMGMIFPLVLQWHLERGGPSRSVAAVYALNTLGCLGGILAATFLVLPRLGVEWTGRFNALIFFCLGVVLLGRAATSLPARAWLATLARPLAQRRWILAPLVLLAASWTAFAPRWNFTETLHLLDHQGSEVYSREDLNGGITTVLDTGEERNIYVNFLFNGGTKLEERDQARVALIPMLYARETDRAVAIGVGTGETAGLVSQFPFREIDVVDFSPRVFEAADLYFKSINLNVFHDPRVRMHVADGRHYLLTHPGKYSLLTLEVNRLWTAGEGDLYTREFYEICSARLTDRGVLQQWVPLFSLSIPEVMIIQRTVRQVFPYVTLYVGGGSGMLVASRAPLEVDYRVFDEMESKPPVAAVLERLNLPHGVSLLGDRVLTPEGMDALLARPGERRISTDLDPFLEHSNARGYLGNNQVAELWDFLLTAEEFRLPPLEGLDPAIRMQIWKMAREEREKQFESLADR